MPIFARLDGDQLHMQSEEQPAFADMNNKNTISQNEGVPINTSITLSKIQTGIERRYVVVVDAGHGGKDPGATGYKQFKEKNLTLEMAITLVKKLNKQSNIRAYLIRNGDYYLTLRKRVQVASIHKPDLFISLHADSFPSKRARGASVYVLSSKGENNEMTRWLVQRENQPLLLEDPELVQNDINLQSVLLDLQNNATMSASIELAKKLLQGMSHVTKIHDWTVGQGAFIVLTCLHVPSILIELGFVSSPRDVGQFSKALFREKLAASIVDVITTNVKEINKYEQTRLIDEQFTYIKVLPGDTLYSLAKLYSMPVDTMRNINKLKSNKLYNGQVLLVKKMIVN